MQSYGRSGDIVIDDRMYHYASEAEKMWLQMIAPGLQTGSVVSLDWQPKSFPLTYKYDKQDCKDTYRPDAIVVWPDGEEHVIEIKRGFLGEKSASKMRRFCTQYPDKDLVLVWFGSMPRKGVAKRRIDRLRPLLHHINVIK